MFWSRKRNQPPRTVTCAVTVEAAEPLASLISDVGCHRELNEDSGRIVHSGPERGLLVVVADGMGGHQAGEVASQAAVETIGKEYGEAPGAPGPALEQAFHKAHNRIFKLASENVSMSGMGTTCTALAIVDGQAWAAHVGDSRLYLVRGDDIYQLSEDHTQCMEMVRRGLMTLEEARRNEDRNVLSHAMGTRPELKAMFWPEPMSVRPGDRFLLCSDGLHDLVADAEMREVAQGSDAEVVCRKLIGMAKERGGYDNITVAVVSIPGSGSSPPPAKETRAFEVAG